MQDDAIAADVGAAYRETLRRERKDYPAYMAAVKVYLGHRPDAGNAGMRVAEIIARAADEWAQRARNQ